VKRTSKVGKTTPHVLATKVMLARHPPKAIKSNASIQRHMNELGQAK